MKKRTEKKTTIKMKDREIKFKYYIRKREGEIISFVLTLDEIQKRTGEWLVLDSTLKEIGLENYEILDRAQFTGQKDSRDSRDIFHGDIVNYMFDYDDEKLKRKAKRYVGHIVWCEDHSSFEIAKKGENHGLIFNAGEFCICEVIGNTLQNPELLDAEPILEGKAKK